MKVIGNFFKGILVSVWLVIALISLVWLLSSDDFLVSHIGDYSMFIVDNNSLEPNFKKNDIVIATKAEEKEYEVGDMAFFIYGNKETVSYINLGQITNVERINRAEDNFTFDDLKISYGHMIGLADKTYVIHGIGLFLSIMTSKWGFMFLVILPTLYAIVYEIYVLAQVVKEDTKKELKKVSKKKTSK